MPKTCARSTCHNLFISNGRKTTYCSPACKNAQQVTNWRRKCKIKAIDHMGGVCYDCGNVYPPAVFEFHHVDGTKEFGISRQIRSWARVAAELEKCVLLCANCHRMRHNL